MSVVKIGVLIPVIQSTYLDGLLACILKNSVQPNQIIVIDNSKNTGIITARHNWNAVKIHRPDSPLGVNASWTCGIHALRNDVDLISVLNDDLLIENLFFEKMIRLATRHTTAGVLCAETVMVPEMIEENLPLGRERCEAMHRREGWAWTIRSEVAKKIPVIPRALRTWCGDDWYWHHCHKTVKRPWLKMMGVWCFHYVGQSAKLNVSGITEDLRKEKALYQNLLSLGLPPR